MRRSFSNGKPGGAPRDRDHGVGVHRQSSVRFGLRVQQPEREVLMTKPVLTLERTLKSEFRQA